LRLNDYQNGSYNLPYNGIIAYVENKSIEEWFSVINNKIINEYPNDSILI
jgi:hypothetical protein